MIQAGWYDIGAPTGTLHYFEGGYPLCPYVKARKVFLTPLAELGNVHRDYFCKKCDALLASNVRRLVRRNTQLPLEAPSA